MQPSPFKTDKCTLMADNKYWFGVCAVKLPKVPNYIYMYVYILYIHTHTQLLVKCGGKRIQFNSISINERLKEKYFHCTLRTRICFNNKKEHNL